MTQDDRELFKVAAVARIAATLLAGERASGVIGGLYPGRLHGYTADALLLWNESEKQCEKVLP